MSDYEDYPAKRGGWGAGLFLFAIALVAVGTYVHFQIEPFVTINGVREELSLGQVIGGLVAGVIGLVVGLVAGLFGLGVGLAGAGLGLFITVGVLVGPFLLAWLIFKSMRRNKSFEEG